MKEPLDLDAILQGNVSYDVSMPVERVQELERLSVLRERLAIVKDRYASSRLEIDRAIKLATKVNSNCEGGNY